ncbi:hypothetical protein V5N11_012223 [Cardamine amara subsp. amara]|uniref:Uncharacterized protein n=1 Tax=Cardamine amara subsp. amara TaxID=228776 RepID=A0ABD1BLP1_CARAN
MALDAASNGNFNTRYPEDAVVLIENLASSNSTKNADFERKKQTGNLDGSQIAEVKAKLDLMHNILMAKTKNAECRSTPVMGVDRHLPFKKDEVEEVNYIGGAGFQSQRFQYQQNNNRNFTNNYQPIPPKSPENKMESMLEQLLEGQQKITVDFNGKIDALYTDLNGKIEQLNVHVKKLDTQVAQTAEAVKRQDSTLPGRTDANPRYQCNAIMLNGDISAKEFEQIDEKFLAMVSEEIEHKDDELPEQVSMKLLFSQVRSWFPQVHC